MLIINFKYIIFERKILNKSVSVKCVICKLNSKAINLNYLFNKIIMYIIVSLYYQI